MLFVATFFILSAHCDVLWEIVRLSGDPIFFHLLSWLKINKAHPHIFINKLVHFCTIDAYKYITILGLTSIKVGLLIDPV